MTAGRRVALVARGGHVAGGEVSLLGLAVALRESHRPLLWITESGELADLARDRGLELVRGEWAFLDARRPRAFLGLARRLARRLAEKDIDLVHVNSPVEAAPFVVAARLLGLPLVVHVRIVYPRAFLWRQGLALADAVIFNSHALRREVGWVGGRVIHNGVELTAGADEADRRRLRRELGAEDGEILLGQVGQVIPMKGVDLSLKAVARLRASGLPARLAVIGEDRQEDGRHLEAMRGLARELGLENAVSFQGYRRDAARLMAGMDLLLCPSREEPFGRVLIEAMAVGVVPIAAHVGGIPEVVRHEREGLLVPAEDSAALAGAIRRLVADDALRLRLAESGYRRARERFSLDEHARRVVRLHDEVAAPYVGGAS